MSARPMRKKSALTGGAAAVIFGKTTEWDR